MRFRKDFYCIIILSKFRYISQNKIMLQPKFTQAMQWNLFNSIYRTYRIAHKQFISQITKMGVIAHHGRFSRGAAISSIARIILFYETEHSSDSKNEF